MRNTEINHIMIDLETLSTNTNAAIISIAAVAFNIKTGETGETFECYITPSEWGKHDRHINGETILWWFNQPAKARKRFNTKETVGLKNALLNLKSFINRNKCDGKIVVWGNGSTMDITVLQSAYEYFDINMPWNFNEVNDVRTIVALNPKIKRETEFKGVKHNAVDDCKHQINYLVNTIKSL